MTITMQEYEKMQAQQQTAQPNQIRGLQTGAIGGYVPAATVLTEAQLLALRVMANAPKPGSIEAQMISAEMRAMYERCAAIIAKI